MNFLAMALGRWLTPCLLPPVLRFLARRPYRLLYCILAEEIGLLVLAAVFWFDDALHPAGKWCLLGFLALGFLFFAGWSFWYACRVHFDTWQEYWEEVLEKHG